VIETQPGSVNWAPINNALWPGETRALAWQTIGHGSDAVMYWQWRDALNGQEQYHGAIAGPDAKPLPIYDELAQLGKDLELTRGALAGTVPVAEIAILHDYESRWAIDFQPHTREYEQQQVLLRFYTPLQRIAAFSGGAVDIVEPNIAPLDGYKFVVAPSLNVISQALADKLVAYVRQGGHLLLGPRSGMKDEYNALNSQRQPGPLIEALGGRVEQYYALDAPVAIAGTSSTADIWGEHLSTASPETTIDLRYGAGNGWLEGKAAMISRKVGKGSIMYLGTLPKEDLMHTILARAGHDAGVTTEGSELPKDVEFCMRSNATHSVGILINHSNAEVQAALRGNYRGLLPSIKVASEGGQTRIDLPAQGVAVLELDKEQTR
jgi:beta-galactosidase